MYQVLIKSVLMIMNSKEATFILPIHDYDGIKTFAQTTFERVTA
jgi:hypothetical protein